VAEHVASLGTVGAEAHCLRDELVTRKLAAEPNQALVAATARGVLSEINKKRTYHNHQLPKLSQ